MPAALSRQPLPPSPVLRHHGPDDPDRAEVEAFIHRVFAQRFGARVRHFMPQLLSLRDPHSGLLIAAAGTRRATAPLFLERYLDAPIDRLIAGRDGLPPPRAAIAEIGQLAASRAGAGRLLIPALLSGLHEEGARWATCTLTEELRHLVLRLGLAPQVLGVADPARLGEEAADWGCYYEHQPLVIAGRLGPAVERLQARFGSVLA